MILSQRHLSEDDLALFALQLLGPEEQEAALDHLEHCEDCRHDVARFQGDLVGYALALSEPASPPAQARERLLKRVAKEKKVVAVERPAARMAERPVQAERPLQAERPSQAAQPIAERPPAERPMQQVAERLAQRTSGTVPVAGAANADGAQESRNGGLHAAEGELFLASRGRRMFGAEPAEDEETSKPPRRMGVVLPFLAITGWAVAAGLAVTAGLQVRQRQNVQADLSTMSAKVDRANDVLSTEQTKIDTLTDPNAMQVALHIPVDKRMQQPDPEGHVAYMADKGALVFLGDHLKPLPEGKTYELWLIPPDPHQPAVPAGLFKPDARGVASLVLPELPKGLAAGGFGVTIENDGGSQTPTVPIVLAGV